MSCGKTYASQLRARGYRMTPQRLAILHTLIHSGGHLSPAEVYERTRGCFGGLTETTVYRTLEFLGNNGLVRSSLTGSGHLVYEAARHEHHHLICRLCGKEVEVDHTIVKPMFKKLEATSGYTLSESHMTFFGLCPGCQSKLEGAAK